jgi:hypothetical protein
MAYRLGDDIDDYCVKCKRISEHAIVALMGDQPAKVRCRSCYNEQAFRNGIAPPSKRDLKKAELFNAVLASGQPAADPPASPPAKKPGKKG